MSFFSLMAALLLEHFQPLPQRLRHYPLFTRYARYLERKLNAGQYRHGVIGWLLAVVPLMAAAAAGYYALHSINPVLGWLWNAGILYLTLGFKHFSVAAAEVGAALRSENLGQARELLARWSGRQTDELDAGEIARLGIEQTLACAHKHLFGGIFWFAVLGPAGAVLYRFSGQLGQKWGGLDEQESGLFGQFAVRAFEWLDWLPLRLTAISFAVVGDFEDAMYCWRSQADGWVQRGLGIVLASGAGALGVKLGEPLRVGGAVEFRPELGLGDEADADYMQSALGLVWRALGLWLVLMLLLTLARWTGG